MAPQHRPTPEVMEAWAQQAQVLYLAAQVAQQWNDATLAEELQWLAQRIERRIKDLS